MNTTIINSLIISTLFLLIIYIIVIKVLGYKLIKNEKTTTDEPMNLLVTPLYKNKQNPDYNTLTELPYIVDPINSSENYAYKKIKIENNKNSPLLQKTKSNLKKINNFLKKYKKQNSFDGYNTYNNLSKVSYSNVTSIGKPLLTPYNDIPVPIN